jgi:hypothetical protein
MDADAGLSRHLRADKILCLRVIDTMDEHRSEIKLES